MIIVEKRKLRTQTRLTYRSNDESKIEKVVDYFGEHNIPEGLMVVNGSGSTRGYMVKREPSVLIPVNGVDVLIVNYSFTEKR